MSTTAPIDRFLRGDANAFTGAQRRGWTIFNGKGRCNTCHAFNATYPFFTDNKFHNLGVAAHKQDFTALATRAERAITTGKPEEIDRMALETDFSELGRFLVTRNRYDMGAFKTPGLREIVVTGPYMHDGNLRTLWDVMDHYNKGGEPNPFLDGGMQRLGLTEDEINDLVELMAAFTSDRFAALGNMEMQRQRTFSRGPRSERDNDAAMGRKGHFGDAVPIFHDAQAVGCTIGVSCDMCHPNAANTHPETYPKYQVQMQKVALLRDMINWCLQHPSKGKPLADDDPKLRAMEAYIMSQRAGKAMEPGKH